MADIEIPFLNYLNFQDLQANYKQDSKEILKSLRKKHNYEHQEQIERKLEGIKEDKEHRTVLNACIFPFCQEDSSSKYGYDFVRASPLSEIGITNMDFLLYRQVEPSCLIFGEAKGQTASPEIAVDQLKDRIREVSNNRQYIRDNYISDLNAYYEFVLGTSFIYGNSLMKSVLRKGGGIIIWITGSMNAGPLLSIIIPSKEEADTTVKSMKHKDEGLSRKLGKSIETSFDFKNVFPESHIFTKLLLLAPINSIDGIFSYDELFGLVKEEMDYLDDMAIQEHTDHILKIAQKINFIESEENNTYRIISRSRRADVREREIRKKWIEFSITKDNDKEIKNSLNDLKIKYIKIRQERKTILDYGND